MSTAREDRATRVNDVRRGTRELLARIRQERIARADKTVPVAAAFHRHEQPDAPAGLMPDPNITRLSQQLHADALTGAAPTAAPAAAVAPLQQAAPPQQAPAPQRREASAPGRITRDYDSSRLGISPLNSDHARLTLDLSASRGSAAATQQRYAKLAGLQPFEPLLRDETGRNAGSGAVAAAGVAAERAGTALPGIETIPTLGPGLIWRLSQAGICTMAELAACDAASVRTKLGQLGRLVKVEDWIAHARAVVADPAHTAAP